MNLALTRSLVTASTLVLLAAYPAIADAPRILPAGQLPDDHRLGALRTLNDYFPFTPVDSKETWAKWSEYLRRKVMLAEGLWPMPPQDQRPPLNAQVFGKVDRDDYTVEKVILESFPGHYVTGSLYRPKGKSGKLPAVLNPHGHWNNGRFHEWSEQEIRKFIAIGAERFETSGRYPLQARPVQQARMGCVAFFVDMEGYADSVQLAHRPTVREVMSAKDDWGMFSAQADLRLINMMGLQTWNAVRAMDFLTSLPDVDPAKVAVTGASGGGTQTMILTAIDPRVAVSMPAVMVSTAMQGGCTCENAPYLRIGAGNVDVAALAAPRPLEMVSANDWTKEFLTKGYPDLKNLYAMLGVPDLVHADAFVHHEHNYNAVSRCATATFLNQRFALGQPDPVIERDFVPLTTAELSVWDAQHPKPSGDQVGDAHERKLVKQMNELAQKQIDAVQPKDAASLAEFRRVIGGAFDVILGRRLEDVGTVKFGIKDKSDRGDYLQMTGLVTREGQPPSPLFSESNKRGREQLPALFLHPKGWNGQVVIWIGENGKSDLLAADGSPTPAVAKLLESKFSVLAADLLYQGEFTKDGKPVADQRVQGYTGAVGKGERWTQSTAYTFGYNLPLFSQRVNDVLTLIRFVQTDQHEAKQIHLVGLGKSAGPIAAAARAQAGDAIAKAAINADGFRFELLEKVTDPMFLPGAVRYGDIPALLALNAPGRLWVVGDDAELKAAKDAYAAAGKADQLTVAPKAGDADGAVEWLRQP
jgi:hypothetical protein